MVTYFDEVVDYVGEGYEAVGFLVVAVADEVAAEMHHKLNEVVDGV